MKLTISKLLGIAALAFAAVGGSFIAATPAQAAITCTAYNVQAIYPYDSHAFRCINTASPTTPTLGRSNALFNTISGPYAGSINLPAGVKTRLQSHNVKYFFFNNRTEADTYFSSTPPYNNGTMIVRHSFTGTAAGTRCGNTGYGWDLTTQVIAVAIYDNCFYDHLSPPKVVPNPELSKTILHETGHAYDFSFGTFLAQTVVPSSKPAFNSLLTQDINQLTPANWSSLLAAQKDAVVCNLFIPNSNKPSDLEKDLANNTLTPPANPLGKICNAGSPNGTRLAYWVTPDKTPTQIVQASLPYFTNPTFAGFQQELWAEMFVTEIYGQYGTVNFLAFSDGVLVNTTGTPDAFNCTRQVLNSYAFFGGPPASLNGMCNVTGPL